MPVCPRDAWMLVPSNRIWVHDLLIMKFSFKQKTAEVQRIYDKTFLIQGFIKSFHLKTSYPSYKQKYKL